MSATIVRCLRAHARLADPAAELRRARGQAVRGDAAWQRRLQGYEHGDMLILSLTATAVIDGDGDSDADRSARLCFCHEVVWIGRQIAPGALAERLRERCWRDFEAVAAGLRDRGITPSASADAIAIELEIEPAVAQRLGTPAATEQHLSAPDARAP